MLMNYTKACNPYSKFPAPVNGTSAIGCAEKAIFSGISRHVSHYRLCIKDGRKIDPAAGSGNFLTETYLSIRRLENEAIEAMEHGQMMIGEVKNPIKVCISQFHGIEIDDFAVTVAKTALWIAESQMMKETENILYGVHLEFLPLKTNANIIEANALRIDWNDVVPVEKLNYIMGNPPFVGYGLQTKSQKEDLLSIYVDENGKAYKTAGKIDYVTAWYFKAAQYTENTNVHCGFVSTNSITQGEQVISVWQPIIEHFHTHIDFAYKTFRWDSEASIKAHVHCVIVGFSSNKNTPGLRRLYEKDMHRDVENISPYLISSPTIFIASCSKPICDVPAMTTGNRPADGGHLIIEAEDYDAFIQEEPEAKKYIKKLTGAVEYINNKKRYCLWLVGASPAEFTWHGCVLFVED